MHVNQGERYSISRGRRAGEGIAGFGRNTKPKASGESWWLEAPRDGFTALAESLLCVEPSGALSGQVAGRVVAVPRATLCRTE